MDPTKLTTDERLALLTDLGELKKLTPAEKSAFIVANIQDPEWPIDRTWTGAPRTHQEQLLALQIIALRSLEASIDRLAPSP
jgi:hypothetical protein